MASVTAPRTAWDSLGLPKLSRQDWHHFTPNEDNRIEELVEQFGVDSYRLMEVLGNAMNDTKCLWSRI
jgi:hypothetical protein